MNRVFSGFAAVVFLTVIACTPWSSVQRTPLVSGSDGSRSGGAACRLASAKTFAVVYSNWDFESVAALDPDVLVIDWKAGRNACGELDQDQVRRLRARPGNPSGDRLVLARLNIGRPEPYRVVFQAPAPDGTCVPAVMIPTAPSLGEGVAPGVADQEWGAAIAGGPDSAVARIIQLGFEGIYVDGTGAGIAALQPDQAAALKIGGLVRAVAGYARSLAPETLFVVVNPVGIAQSPGFANLVSGVAFHGSMFRDGYVLPSVELVPVLDGFNLLKVAGVPVLSVEFIDDGIQDSHYRRICTDMGYLCYPGVADLNHLEPLLSAGNGGHCR